MKQYIMMHNISDDEKFIISLSTESLFDILPYIEASLVHFNGWVVLDFMYLVGMNCKARFMRYRVNNGKVDLDTVSLDINHEFYNAITIKSLHDHYDECGVEYSILTDDDKQMIKDGISI